MNPSLRFDSSEIPSHGFSAATGGDTDVHKSVIIASGGSPTMGLAMPVNDNGAGGLLTSKLGSQDVDGNSILIKLARNGDSDLNGTVDAADYLRIDRGFMTQTTGYANGDFDYSGDVNADDYFLIDSAIMAQNAISQLQAAPRVAKAAPIAKPVQRKGR